MNLLKREVHKSFSDLVATYQPLPAALFLVTTLYSVNDDDDKKLFYYRVNSKVVAELINNILTDAEYYNLVLKNNMFTFLDDSTGNEIIDGPFLIKLLFDRIDTHVVV